MDFIAKKTDLSKQKTQCAVVFASADALSPSASAADKKHTQTLSKMIKSKDLESNAGKCAWISVPKSDKSQPYDRLLLVQIGKTKNLECTKQDWILACSAAITAINASKAKDATFYLDTISIKGVKDSTEQMAQELAFVSEKLAYRYSTTKNKVQKPELKKITVASKTSAAIKKALTKGKALGEGLNTARELGNLPGNICTPSYLADQAKTMATGKNALSVKVLTEKQMEKLKMGSLLSVSRGSVEEAKLIIMEFRNGPKNAKPHVLVGKGITFDTGGISLKPGPQMDEMKFDMCGAASVFGAMTAIVAMNAPVNVIAIVAAAENMPAGNATKPGDVVTSMSGQTIEVLNTDAEGRLVLCDALTYAERYRPKSVIDIATLTGACVIALGSVVSGLYSNNEKLAQSLLKAGEDANDRAWQMPLYDEYQKQLDSNFADIANIGGREAGSVTAACFLSRFTKKYQWAHLDIAGTAWLGGGKKGATGRPVRLLVEYLLNN